MSIIIRPAMPSDAFEIVEMLKDFAGEGGKSVSVGSKEVCEWLESEVIYGLIAEVGGEVTAMAVYYYGISTFRGTKNLFVEDLFVKREFRRRHIGSALYRKLVEIAKTHSSSTIRWLIRTHNTRANEWYKSIAGDVDVDWGVYQMNVISGK
ncbi:N-acetyltransferase [Fibrobacterales bacterium]|nr:N-acetyltransferase [Fibrobacterales bacterium]